MFKNYREFASTITDPETTREAQSLISTEDLSELDAIARQIPNKKASKGKLFLVIERLTSMKEFVIAANKMNEGFYGKAETEGFSKCSKCGSSRTTLKQVQDRSGDEGMSNYNVCDDCRTKELI